MGSSSTTNDLANTNSPKPQKKRILLASESRVHDETGHMGAHPVQSKLFNLLLTVILTRLNGSKH